MDLDLSEQPGHPRLSYYAGALRYEIALELPGNQERRQLAMEAIKILKSRAKEKGERSEEKQQGSAAAYFCGRSYLDLSGAYERSGSWSAEAIKRISCMYLYTKAM